MLAATQPGRDSLYTQRFLPTLRRAPQAAASPFLLPGQVLRFHERGLTPRLPFKGVTTLPYEAIEHMSWSTVKPAVGVTVHAELRTPERKISFEADPPCPNGPAVLTS